VGPACEIGRNWKLNQVFRKRSLTRSFVCFNWWGISTPCPQNVQNSICVNREGNSNHFYQSGLQDDRYHQPRILILHRISHSHNSQRYRI
jgi:hypothetical protein